MPFQRSLDVPQLSHYSDYRDDWLRPDFRYRCAYCLTHETYFLSGDGGEIDHHRPLNPPAKVNKDFSHLAHVYSNLYWTCGKCNRSKGNTWPTDREFAQGLRFLDPCGEDHAAHWHTLLDGTLRPTTRTGEYTIAKIRLNRRRLREHRRHQQEIQELIQRVEAILAVKSPEQERDLLYAVLANLRQQIDALSVEP